MNWRRNTIAAVCLMVCGCARIQAHKEAYDGYQAHQHGELAKAVLHYSNAHKTLPDNEVVTKNLAFSHIDMAKEGAGTATAAVHYRQAAALLQQLLEKDPKNQEVASILLDAWMDSGNLDQAANYFSEKVKKNSQDAEAIRLLGVIELRRGNYEAALDAYNKRLVLVPKEVGVYAGKATLIWEWLRTGKVTDTAQAITLATMGVDAALEAQKRDPKHPSAKVYASLLLRERAQRQTNPEEAQKDIQLAEAYLQEARAQKKASESSKPKKVSALHTPFTSSGAHV